MPNRLRTCRLEVKYIPFGLSDGRAATGCRGTPDLNLGALTQHDTTDDKAREVLGWKMMNSMKDLKLASVPQTCRVP